MSEQVEYSACWLSGGQFYCDAHGAGIPFFFAPDDAVCAECSEDAPESYLTRKGGIRMTAATAVTVSCPACRESVNTQSGCYAFARAYLCDAHGALWTAADERERHAPGRCDRHRQCYMTEGGVVHMPSNPERTGKCACGQRDMKIGRT